MKKLENLAKILFLFFAVVSLGLVTVSCSDDEENCDSQSFFECYGCVCAWWKSKIHKCQIKVCRVVILF